MVTCLLSGLKVFGSGYPKKERIIRVVNGLHAFHIYANEFWIDHLLVVGKSEQGFEQSPLLCSLLDALSSELGELRKLDQELPKDQDISKVDLEIQCLASRKGLYEAGKNALMARSMRGFMKRVSNEGEYQDLLSGDRSIDKNSETSAEAQCLAGVLARYQRTVQSLLPLQDIPGVSMAVLERFKSSHRSLAFTCRLAGCMRATVGFEDDVSRQHHEQRHIQAFNRENPDKGEPPSPAEGNKNWVFDEALNLKMGSDSDLDPEGKPKTALSTDPSVHMTAVDSAYCSASKASCEIDIPQTIDEETLDDVASDITDNLSIDVPLPSRNEYIRLFTEKLGYEVLAGQSEAIPAKQIIPELSQLLRAFSLRLSAAEGPGTKNRKAGNFARQHKE